MKNKINYLLGDAGWATLKIVTDSKTFEFDISYLYDSLSELSSSAVKLNGSVSNYSVSFMSEPGTFKMDLIKNKKTGFVNVTGRWHNETFANCNKPDSDFEILFTFNMKLHTYTKNILDVLDTIYNTFGEEGYLQKWKNHQFPKEDYLKLKN